MTKCIQRSQEQASQNIIRKYWAPLEGSHKAGAWEILDANYSECHRAYHTWEHIADLLQKLGEFSDLSARANIVALSAFWHDAVYKTENYDGSPRLDHENVRDSAELFRQYTVLTRPDTDAVHGIIMATANHLQARAEKEYYDGFSGDLDLFLDLDLSSLAAPWEEFADDFARIRHEFSSVPDFDFYTKQIQMLENFAKQDGRLYRRAETRDKWCFAAMANLKRCVSDLKKRIAKISSV